VPLDIVLALRATKRAAPILAALRPVARELVCVGNPADAVASSPEALAAAARDAGIGQLRTAVDVEAGLRLLEAPQRVLICGSLYLAGAVLAENG
jgi:dihydrofolate synthase/folylpolyglutamate synthase